MTGARNHPRISPNTAPSVTRIRTQAMSLSCGNGVEVAFQVGVIDCRSPFLEVGADFFQRVVRLASPPEPVGTVQEIRLKDGFQYQDHCHLCHPVFQGGDAQAAVCCRRLWGYTPV